MAVKISWDDWIKEFWISGGMLSRFHAFHANQRYIDRIESENEKMRDLLKKIQSRDCYTCDADYLAGIFFDEK